MHYDHAHREEHTVFPYSRYLTNLIDYVVSVAGIPDCPNDDSSNDRVNVNQEDKEHKALAANKSSRVVKQGSHSVWKFFLIFQTLSILGKADFLIIDAVVQHKPIRHQDIEASDEKVIDRLQTRSAIGERDAEFANSVDDRLDEHHDGKVLDAPGITSPMPEETAPEVLVLRNGVICESGSLVAFLTHEAKAEVSGLDHVDVISSITNG